LVAAHVALSSPKRFAKGGLVLMSAAMDVEWTPVLHVQAALGGLLSCLVPNVQLVPAVSPKDLSRDPEVVAAFEADPLVAHGNTKGRMAYESLCAFRRLQPRYAEFTLPLLAMHGTCDKITSLPAVRRLVAAAASKDKALVEWPGAFHELMHEPEKQQVLDKLTSWILERAGAPAKL
jgi:acylglycerol lipase